MHAHQSKVIIFSAPSGAGKSTIIRYLINAGLPIKFSISATSRKPRGDEKHGVEYYFLSPDEFKQRVANGEFLEYEEVYTDSFYGTLKSEVDRILEQGSNVVLDVDCIGGINIKKIYGDRALSIFVMPPSIQELRNRLEKRATDTPDVIEARLTKAEYEMSFAPQFDTIVLNDDFDRAKAETIKAITDFIGSEQQ